MMSWSVRSRAARMFGITSVLDQNQSFRSKSEEIYGYECSKQVCVAATSASVRLYFLYYCWVLILYCIHCLFPVFCSICTLV